MRFFFNVWAIRIVVLVALTVITDPLLSHRVVFAQETDETKNSDDKNVEDIKVYGKQTDTLDRQITSARAISVIPLDEVRLEAADMGQVLASTQGVSVQRAGGLGSDVQLSLNGLTRDQIRFFIDGIPLELFGYPGGLANAPVNLIERIEVYRGVVPVVLGADALGGAINITTAAAKPGLHADASYQVGSFETHRITARTSYRTQNDAWIRIDGFLDDVANNYRIDDRPIVDERGRESRQLVERFHDAYRARGASIDAGLINQSWADNVSVRAFYSGLDTEIQHNISMTVPYGEIEGQIESGGATAKYTYAHPNGLSVNLLAGGSIRSLAYEDLGRCAYNWLGECVVERPNRGEAITNGVGSSIDGLAITQDDVAFIGRGSISWKLNEYNELKLSISPNLTEREETIVSGDRSITTNNQLLSVVTGTEYEALMFNSRLRNVLFAKLYIQSLAGEIQVPITGAIEDRNRTTDYFGFGNSLRLELFQSLYVKASYELAMRLPRRDEVLGDPIRQIDGNLELEPERSHNLNLGLDWRSEPLIIGELYISSNSFLRDMDDLITPLASGTSPRLSYQNVNAARSIGVEGYAEWTSPRDMFLLSGTATYVDLRITAEEGPFSAQNGERIPNRPYLFGGVRAAVRIQNIFAKDQISLTYNAQYTQAFFRFLEGNGAPNVKDDIPEQLSHRISLNYRTKLSSLAASVTAEVQNLTNERVFDFFGVQKPGRAFYLKTVLEL